MRNLIKFATMYAIALTDSDVEQLGYNVDEETFVEYFGLTMGEQKENADFNPKENSYFMNGEEEKEVTDKLAVTKAKAKGVAKKVTPKKVTKEEDEAKKEAAEAKAKTPAKAKAKEKAEPKEKVKKEPKAKATETAE